MNGDGVEPAGLCNRFRGRTVQRFMTRTAPGPRSLLGVVSVLIVLTAGCAAAGTATPAGPGSGPPGSTVPGSTVPVTPGSSTPASSPVSPVATRPSDLTGPAADAEPMFSMTVHPTYFCDTENSHLPSLVIYDDGTVLRADTIGAHCQPVPTVTIGWVDPNLARQQLTDYFTGPMARVNMRDLQVTDMPFTVLRMPGVGAVSIYGFGYTDDVPAEQEQARQVVTTLIDGLTAAAAATETWQPERLALSAPESGSGAADEAVEWPLPVTPELQKAVSSHGCLALDDPADIEQLLAANRDRNAAGGWVVDGQTVELAIGVVLPGYQPCAPLDADDN